MTKKISPRRRTWSGARLNRTVYRIASIVCRKDSLTNLQQNDVVLGNSDESLPLLQSILKLPKHHVLTGVGLFGWIIILRTLMEYGSLPLSTAVILSIIGLVGIVIILTMVRRVQNSSIDNNVRGHLMLPDGTPVSGATICPGCVQIPAITNNTGFFCTKDEHWDDSNSSGIIHVGTAQGSFQVCYHGPDWYEITVPWSLVPHHSDS